MNYYDELGISPNAPAEEIRDAYLQLARLLHPDRLQDPRQRSLAELQMKRLNHIYQTLSHPEQRRHYDFSLNERHAPQMVFIPEEDPLDALPRRHHHHHHHHHRRRLFGPQWLAAAALGGALFAFILGRITHDEAPEAVPPVSAAAPETARRPEKMPVPQFSQNGASGMGIEPIIVNLRNRLHQAERERDEALARAKATEKSTPQTPASAGNAHASDPAPIPPFQLPPPEAPAAQAAVTTRQPQQPNHPKGWSGRWYYVKPSGGAPLRNMYPPEFIEAALLEENGVVRGRYRARYKIADRAIPPEVDFQFTGKVNQGAMASTWVGPGGAKGEVRVRQVTPDTIEFAWVATDLGRHQGLGYGTAVLVRRQDP